MPESSCGKRPGEREGRDGSDVRGLLERGSGASRGVFYPGDDAGPHGGVGGPGKGQPRQPLHDKAGEPMRD